jgi:hypothetical protein
MRTDVTIEPDVELLLREAVNEQGKTLDEVVNDSLRRALSHSAKPRRQPYTLRPRRLGIKPDVDLEHAFQLADELEDLEITRKWREGR